MQCVPRLCDKLPVGEVDFPAGFCTCQPSLFRRNVPFAAFSVSCFLCKWKQQQLLALGRGGWGGNGSGSPFAQGCSSSVGGSWQLCVLLGLTGGANCWTQFAVSIQLHFLQGAARVQSLRILSWKHQDLRYHGLFLTVCLMSAYHSHKISLRPLLLVMIQTQSGNPFSLFPLPSDLLKDMYSFICFGCFRS